MSSPDVGASETVLLRVDVINPLQFDGAEAILPSALETARGIAKLKRRLPLHDCQTVDANDNYGVWHSDFNALGARCSAAATPAGRSLEPSSHPGRTSRCYSRATRPFVRSRSIRS